MASINRACLYIDVVSVIINLLERPDINNRIYNIAGPESFTYNQFIDKVLKLRHLKKIKVHIPTWIFGVLARISALILKDNFLINGPIAAPYIRESDDISLAAKELSFKPAKLEDLI